MAMQLQGSSRLRRQIVQQAIELREDSPREDWAMAEEAPGAIFRQRFLTALNDLTWVRFVTWEALDPYVAYITD